MKDQKVRKEVLLNRKEVLPKKKETFWTSGALMEKLAEIPEGEKSTIIRMALRQYFGISNCKQVEPIPQDPEQLRAIFQLLSARR